VTNSLNSNNLGSIDVSQDRDKGVITLKGNVASDDAKQQAESLPSKPLRTTPLPTKSASARGGSECRFCRLQRRLRHRG